MKKNQRLGLQRRLLLLALLVSAVALATWSFGAMASRSAPPAAATPSAAVAAPGAKAAPGAADASVAPVKPGLPATPAPTPAATPTPAPTPTPVPALDFSQPAPQREPAAEDYFNDAVFIGDSRSDGLRLYSGIRGADFLAYKALMVFEVTGTHGVEQKKIPVGDGKKTVLAALGEKQYGKVYIMLGINELGWNKSSDFDESFRQLVDEVRALQPDAVIYIESLVPVNPEKCKTSKAPYYITNEKIATFNDLLRQMCADKNLVFLDLADGLTAGSGVLPAEATSDGIHFVRSYYVKWLEYLQSHTVDAAAYAAGQG